MMLLWWQYVRRRSVTATWNFVRFVQDWPSGPATQLVVVSSCVLHHSNNKKNVSWWSYVRRKDHNWFWSNRSVRGKCPTIFLGPRRHRVRRWERKRMFVCACTYVCMWEGERERMDLSGLYIIRNQCLIEKYRFTCGESENLNHNQGPYISNVDKNMYAQNQSVSIGFSIDCYLVDLFIAWKDTRHKEKLAQNSVLGVSLKRLQIYDERFRLKR